MSHIHDNNLVYRFLFIFVKKAFAQFFRQVTIRGAENIPVGEPVIFAPNHQNGLIDSLLVLFSQHDAPIVYMGRADLFSSTLVKKALRFIKIMPVFRIRDGYENLGKNEALFNEAKLVLLDCKYLCIMPEGNHGPQHTLRNLVKGLFRIAFSTEASLPLGKHVSIVPMGIDHSYFEHAGSDVVVSFGKPLSVKDYVALYDEQPAVGINALKNELAARLSLLMQDIRSEKRYELIYKLSCLGAYTWLEVNGKTQATSKTRNNSENLFDARRNLGMMLDALDEGNNPLLDDWEALCTQLDQLPGYPNQVAEWLEMKPAFSTTFNHLLGSLFFLPGLLMNTPVWVLTRLMLKRIEDKQMHQTVAFVVGAFVNLLVYLVIATVVGVGLSCTVVLTIGLFVSLVVYGTWAERWRQRMRLPTRQFVYSFGERKTLLKRCKTDYFFLKKSMKQWMVSGQR